MPEVTQLYRGRSARIPTRSLSLASVVFFGLLLSGCASMEMLQPTESPASSAPPMSSQVPSPDIEAETTLIEVSATGFDLLDVDGERIDSFDYYDDDSAEVILTLTDLFGAEPTVETQDVATHFRSYDTNTWKGFVVWDYGSVGAGPGEPAFAVHVTAQAINHITVETNDGVAIGDAEASAADASYNSTNTGYDGRELTIYSLDETLLPDGIQTYIEDGPAAYSVQAWVFSDTGTVDEITAPNANFGS